MQFFDTHTHLGLIVDDPIEQLIIAQEAKRDGVLGIVSICNSLLDFFELYKNLSIASNVFYAIGISPSEIDRPGKDWQMKLEEGLKLKNIVALGETGLDYARVGNHNKQVELFIKQLEIADNFNKPVIIHNREADADIFDILKTRMPKKGLILHCFSQDIAFAEKMMALSEHVYISFAGNVTYKNAKKLQETALLLPLDRMLLETESPFMIPAKYREKKRTRPSYIHSIAEHIAELRNETTELIAEQTFKNACKIFNLNL